MPPVRQSAAVRFEPSMRPSRLHIIATWTALLSLALRAVVPLGYMPGALVSGDWITPCPTGFPAAFFKDAGHAHHHAHHGNHAQHGRPGAQEQSGWETSQALEADRPCPLGEGLQLAALLPQWSPAATGRPESTPPFARPPVLRTNRHPGAARARAPPRPSEPRRHA